MVKKGKGNERDEGQTGLAHCDRVHNLWLRIRQVNQVD